MCVCVGVMDTIIPFKVCHLQSAPTCLVFEFARSAQVTEAASQILLWTQWLFRDLTLISQAKETLNPSVSSPVGSPGGSPGGSPVVWSCAAARPGPVFLVHTAHSLPRFLSVSNLFNQIKRISKECNNRSTRATSKSLGYHGNTFGEKCIFAPCTSSWNNLQEIWDYLNTSSRQSKGVITCMCTSSRSQGSISDPDRSDSRPVSNVLIILHSVPQMMTLIWLIIIYVDEIFLTQRIKYKKH